MEKRTTGIALGSGAARGWAHIGVLKALEAMDVSPQVVAGSSMGALVGAFYAADKLDALEDAVRELPERGAWFYDFSVTARGGFVPGKKIESFIRDEIGDVAIESLPKAYAAVATELETGKEVVIDKGSLVDAVRASIALPGMLTPVKLNDVWVSDGGLVNPVPVSVLRDKDVDAAIAVVLEGGLVPEGADDTVVGEASDGAGKRTFWDELSEDVSEMTKTFRSQFLESLQATPGLFTVIARAIDIMSDRIIQAGLAQYPADVVLRPDVGHLALLDFAEGPDTIEAGRRCVEGAREDIEAALRGASDGD